MGQWRKNLNARQRRNSRRPEIVTPQSTVIAAQAGIPTGVISQGDLPAYSGDIQKETGK